MADAIVDLHEIAVAVASLVGKDMSEPMAVIAELLVSEVSDKFEQGGPGWPPLAPSTLKKRRGGTAQILVDTGRFAGSIRADSGDDFAEAATDVEYAVYHVSDEPRTVIPKRDPFDLEDRVFDEAANTILEHVIS